MSHIETRVPTFEELEARDTPAVTASLVNGLLFLSGTPQADRAVVSTRADLLVIETQRGKGSQELTFAQADVRGIVFLGFEGQDVFVNQTVVNAIAFGGVGRDSLQAGLGRDTLLGGPGDDQLIGDADDRVAANLGLRQQTQAKSGSSFARRLTTDPLFIQGLNSVLNISATPFANAVATLNTFNGAVQSGTNANLLGVASVAALGLTGTVVNPAAGAAAGVLQVTPTFTQNFAPGSFPTPLPSPIGNDLGFF